MKNLNNTQTTSGLKLKLINLINSLLTVIQGFATFIAIFVTPYSLILFIVAVVLLNYSQEQTGITKVILDCVFAVVSATLGGLLWNYISEFKGNSFLIKKSKAAIRNLRLIKYKVDNISKRVTELYDESNKRDFEEISNLTQNIQKDIINSISDWGDITPAAVEITDYLELTNQAEIKFKDIEKEKKELERQLATLDKGKTEEIIELKNEIQNKELEIDKIKSKISDYGLLSPNYSTFSGTLSGDSGPGYYLVGPDRTHTIGDSLNSYLVNPSLDKSK